MDNPLPAGEMTKCARHCNLCEGQDHHWMYAGNENDAGEPIMNCKHCEATRLVEDDDCND